MNRSDASKESYLREQHLLNPAPADVTDALFQQSVFFDPRDLLLVKYEMLRRVRVEGTAVEPTAAAFGFSRSGFYKVLSAWQQKGLPGLLPARPGPRGAHKLGSEVLEFIDRLRSGAPQLRVSDVVSSLAAELGLKVHARSIERALGRRKKTDE